MDQQSSLVKFLNRLPKNDVAHEVSPQSEMKYGSCILAISLTIHKRLRRPAATFCLVGQSVLVSIKLASVVDLNCFSSQPGVF